MSSHTDNLKLFKYDPETDGASTFSLKTALNDNWDRLDAAVAGKADVRLSNLANPAAALARLGAGVRPNLLLNPFFAVNQRGQSTYTTTGYTVDGWRMAANTASSLTVQEDGVLLTAISQYGTYVGQQIPPEEVARLRGETICFSAFCGQNDNAAWTANIYVNDQWRDAFALTPNAVSAKVFAVPGDAQRIHLSYGAGAAGSCKLRAAKVELGNTQTLGYQDEDGAWHLLPQPESDYATQLARCQRYQIPIDGAIRYRASQIYADLILFYLPLPVTMVTTPIIESAGADRLHVYNWAGVQQSGFTAYVAGLATGGVLIGMRKAAHGLTDALLYVDAQMGQGCPMLSANL